MISLAQTAILLAAAVIAVSLFRFLRLSSILGYVAAGLAIGPWGLNLIGDISRIRQVSEFGVVLLLFIIGLELQPTRLWVMRRTVFGLGAAQVLLCTRAPGAPAPGRSGQPPVAAGVVGFGLSLSSTPLVLQVLAERDQLKTQYGRAAFGILLFQDLAVLPVLAVLPLLSPLESSAHGRRTWWLALLKLLAVIAVVIGGGRLLLRPALRIVARVRVSEVFTAAALLTVIATALLVEPGRPVRWRSARSSPACCSPTASSATSSKRTSSRSRDCCSACSSSRWACRPISGCCARSR